VGDKRCIGLWACIELVADKKTKAPLAGFNDSIRNVSGPLAKIFMDNGLYLYSNWDYICISPPMIINRQQIDEMLEIVEKGLSNTSLTTPNGPRASACPHRRRTPARPAANWRRLPGRAIG
jgi:adenosylmethionine-8-amino-7-oxononanoate aminotransferase